MMKRHLLMHIWAKDPPGTWRLSVAEIVKRWDVFTGRKVIAICGSHDSAPASKIKEMFPDDIDLEFFEMPNDSGLREVVTFFGLMKRVESQPGMTLFCHAKGSTHYESSICQDWMRVMADVLLDHVDLCEEALETCILAGCFRRKQRFGLNPNNWHYSGTWYWFRNDKVFQKPDWWRIDNQWFGTEAWPGLHFHEKQGAVIFLDNVGDLYDQQYWDMVVRPAFKSWNRHPVIMTPIPPVGRCDFVPFTGHIGHNICLRCKKIVHDVILLQDHFCSGPQPTTPTATGPKICSHRQRRKRGVVCSPCGGKTIPVFHCELHGECIAHVAGIEESIRNCEECLDDTTKLSGVQGDKQSV